MVSNILLLVFCVVWFGCVSPMSCVLCPVFCVLSYVLCAVLCPVCCVLCPMPCVMCPVCPVVPVSLDGPLLIALSGFADVY